MHWNWDHIRFFLAVAEQGNLSLTARTLDVSHSTVLRRIRQLELDLNTQLFDHTNTGYTLTAAGKTLHIEAIKMRSTMTALSREISGADNQMEGEVIITTTDTLAQYILPNLLTTLSQKYVGINFTLQMANDLSDMENRDADIAIRTCKKPPENLIGRQVAELKFEATASYDYVKKHSIEQFPTNVDDHHFISLDESYSSTPFYQWLYNRIEHSTSVTKVNNFLTAAALAREGLGITILPSYVRAKEKSLVKLETDTQVSRNDLWVLSHSDSRNTEKVKVVRQFLSEQLTRILA